MLFFKKLIGVSNTQPPALRPCCFGKLPMHADFLRYNVAATRETSSFEKWLSEGVGCILRKHPEGWPTVYREFPPYHFFISGGEQENNLVGSLMASRDKSGRIYPFTTLSVARAPHFHTNRAALPLVFADYFTASAALLGRSWAKSTVAILTACLEDLPAANPALSKMQLVERQRSLLETTPMQQYWEGLSQPVPARRREQYWCTFYNVMRTIVSRGPKNIFFGIRIPIPSEKCQICHVLFWIQMIETIVQDRFWRAHVFWTRGREGRDSNVTIFFRPPPPSYLPPLLNTELHDNAVFDIGREWPRFAGFNSRVDLRRFLESDRTSMLDVLYKTARKEML